MSGGEHARAAILAAADSLRRDAARLEPALASSRLTAIFWATVELDRAERELGAILGTPLAASLAPRDPALGASVRTARPFGQASAPVLRLVEPDTEGRLAALLARHGEGVVAIELEIESDGGTRRIELTSGLGGRPPRGASDPRPEALD